MKTSRFLVGLALLALLHFGCNASINKSIHVPDGEKRRGDLNSVNGSVIVGSDCEIRGDCRSVNGRVEVGRASSVGDLQSVNGGITMEPDVFVDGDAESVNGSIRGKTGVKIEGRLSTINGDIDLLGAEVKRDVVTINGDITLADKAVVRGDVIVEDQKGRSSHPRHLNIRISGESVVEGDVIVEDDDIDVRVILSGGGRVMGEIKNAEVVKE